MKAGSHQTLESFYSKVFSIHSSLSIIRQIQPVLVLVIWTVKQDCILLGVATYLPLYPYIYMIKISCIMERNINNGKWLLWPISQNREPNNAFSYQPFLSLDLTKKTNSNRTNALNISSSG